MRSPLERAVREVHSKLTETHEEFCACEQCADDVIAMVMNQTRPRYTTTGLGWAVETADLDTDQVRAEIAVLVFEAMNRVAEQPRHAPSEAVTRKRKPSGA
ncbi:MAG TPA: late competence development ComFB family protein [Gemmatimonadaceae bacterium]|nr:late competence development ComFB family protein [Gemmatimonadaceae bacterium]